MPRFSSCVLCPLDPTTFDEPFDNLFDFSLSPLARRIFSSRITSRPTSLFSTFPSTSFDEPDSRKMFLSNHFASFFFSLPAIGCRRLLDVVDWTILSRSSLAVDLYSRTFFFPQRISFVRTFFSFNFFFFFFFPRASLNGVSTLRPLSLVQFK